MAPKGVHKGLAGIRPGLSLSPTAKKTLAHYMKVAGEAAQQRAAAIAVQESPLDKMRSEQDSHPVPSEWVRRLREISPESLIHGWLAFGWLTWAERFVLYECIPDQMIPDEMRAMLAGRPWWELPESEQEGRKKMVSAYQWDMYRRYRVWAVQFWCLQGDQGGTPALYTDIEKAILRAHDRPQTPIKPGALPFAPFDERAVKAVQERDRLAKYRHSVAALKNSGASEIQKAEAELAEMVFRKEWWSVWEETMAPQADFLASVVGQQQAEDAGMQRPATKREEMLAHTAKDQFIEHGYVGEDINAPDGPNPDTTLD